jgi:POT family proton-dependent oligopeptide transporter
MSDAPDDPAPAKGHPRGLYVCFSAEMWERFCFYTVQSLLTLYLIKALAMGDEEAFAIYGAYTALVYASPVIGGQIADRILGYRRAILLGGVMMVLGELVVCVGTEQALYLGMGLIVVGNGYFKANVSTVVGKLYDEGDPRRDSGFTIFYMGINVGAVLATLFGAPLGEGLAKGPIGDTGYLVGFALAGVGMVLGLFVFWRGRKVLQGVGEAPDPARLAAPFFAGLSLQTVTIVASFAAVPLMYLLLQAKAVVDALLVLALGMVLFQLLRVGFREGKVQRDRIIVLMVLMVFNVVFWACFEQAGSSLILFADRNVDRMVLGYEMPASQTQFFNPAFIILFGSLFAALWVKLDARNRNPNIPMKFGLGIVQLGLGYLVLELGAEMAGVDARVPLLILALMYMLHTTGELFLSPIGLSMVTKLAPKTMTGQVMGAWFLSWAFSNSAAAALATLTGTHQKPTPIGDMVDAAHAVVGPGRIEQLVDEGTRMLGGAYWDEQAAAAQESLASYVDVYTTMGLVTVAIGLGLVLFSGVLNKMMHGVK